MLKSFRVYLNNGRILTLEFRRFEYDEEQFYIYKSSDSVTSHTFLSFKLVAAIIPEEPQENEYGYTVYLRNGNSFEVPADYYILQNKLSVRFFLQNPPQPEKEIDSIYVASSEVAAIMPWATLEVT
jgi:hypothetical protein